MISKPLFSQLLALPVLLIALYFQGTFAFEEAENITLSSHGVLLSEEKSQLRSDGFDIKTDDTLIQLSPRHHGWLKFSLSLDEMHGDNVVFPDGSIFPIDTSIENDLIFWLEDRNDQEDNGRFVRLSLSSAPDALSHAIVSIDGRKVHLGAIRQEQARSNKDNLQLANLKLSAVVITTSDEIRSPVSGEDGFPSLYSEYPDNGLDSPYSKKSPPPAYGGAQVPLFNQLDALFETVGSIGSPWLISGGNKIDLTVKQLSQMSLSKRLYLDSIVGYQAIHSERMVQVNMLFTAIKPQSIESTANLEPLEVIMNWLASEVRNADEMHSINQALLQTEGAFQTKDTFLENYINKKGGLRARKLLQNWINRFGEKLPGELKATLKRKRYDFPEAVSSAFDKMTATQDMVQGIGRVEYQPERTKVKTLSSQKTLFQVEKRYRPLRPGATPSSDEVNFYRTVQGAQQTVTGAGLELSGIPSQVNVVQPVSDPSKAQPERRLIEWRYEDEEEEEEGK